MRVARARLSSVSVACALVAYVASACGSSTGVGNDVLRARVDGRHLTLSTEGSDTVYYFAVDRAALPVVDWIACTRPTEGCRRVWRAAPARIPLTELAWRGEGGGREIFVSYWRLQGPPAYGIRGRIESLVIPLRTPVVRLSP